MGINGLTDFIKKKHPDLIHTEHVSMFAYERVFIDITSYIYSYATIYGTNDKRWMTAFFNLLYVFRRNKVIPVVIFDGESPPEKEDEKDSRKQQRQKQTDRIENLKDAINKYESGDRSDEVFNILNLELERLESNGKRELKSLLFTAIAKNTLLDGDVLDLKKLLSNLVRSQFSLTQQDINLVKELIKTCGIVWLQAPYEAEAYACFLANLKSVHGTAVLSKDSDCIIHQAPYVITNLDTVTGMIVFIDTEQLKSTLELSDEQLIDWGILMGCDYNPGSRVNKIGPVNGLRLIKEYSRIEDIPGINLEATRHTICRKMFKVTYPEVQIKHISYDLAKLTDICKTHRLDYNIFSKIATALNTKIRFDPKTESFDAYTPSISMHDEF
jgi:5'-3' exonuclease